mgnify:CR=1 FL=1
MSLVKSIGKQKVNVDFNKDFINLFSEKILSNDISFINQTLEDLHAADVADLIENLNTEKQPSVKKGKDSTQAPSRQRLEDNLLDVSENQGLGGTKPEDAEMNAIEQLVSRIVGRNVRFEDIPDDDPFIADMPQNYQNLRRGGQVKRMGHGGAITPEQKKRMTRIAKEYKALRSKKKATAPKVATSKKRSAPFSDMKKAMMNGNKKRTNR